MLTMDFIWSQSLKKQLFILVNGCIKLLVKLVQMEHALESKMSLGPF